MVRVVKAISAPRTYDIVLPGTVLAWHEAPIYARTNGYVKTWYVDIGYAVNAGDILAEIETPELDASLRQAEADLNVTIANNKLAQTTAIRWKKLLKTDSVSIQETEEKVDEAEALAASVIAARANRDRLRELVGFEKVIAPFKGMISDRTTDIGKLVNQGSKPAEAKPLFRMVQTDPLRLYVKIPQTYVTRIQPNMLVRMEFAEHPGQLFFAKLLKTAQAIDTKTRTLLAEFKVNNHQGVLLPGGYTQVHFAMPSIATAVRLPVNTLIFRKRGLQIATLDSNSRVLLKKITVSCDFGNYVEVDSGIGAGEKIIINPSDSIYNGQQVNVVGEIKFNSPATSS